MASLLENVTIDAPENVLDQSNPPTLNFKAKDATRLHGPEPQDKSYDPSMLFLLEMATSLAIRDAESMQDLSAAVAGYCTEILRQPETPPSNFGRAYLDIPHGTQEAWA